MERSINTCREILSRVTPSNYELSPFMNACDGQPITNLQPRPQFYYGNDGMYPRSECRRKSGAAQRHLFEKYMKPAITEQP